MSVKLFASLITSVATGQIEKAATQLPGYGVSQKKRRYKERGINTFSLLFAARRLRVIGKARHHA